MKHVTRSCACLCLAVLIPFSLMPVASQAAEAEATQAAAITPPLPEAPEADTAAAQITDFLGENAAGLLSGATFLLTLVLGYLFRRRLIPPLLESLSALLGKSREALDGAERLSEQSAAETAALLSRAEQLIASATAAALRAEEAAEAIRTGEAAQKTLSPILREQVNLLYELLISANLPQYQKDRIGAAHAAAMALLEEGGHE